MLLLMSKHVGLLLHTIFFIQAHGEIILSRYQPSRFYVDQRHQVQPSTDFYRVFGEKFEIPICKLKNVYLAGYDTEIYKLKRDVEKESKRHTIIVSFYLWTFGGFKNIGCVYSDLETLKRNINKYSHYFQLKKVYIERYKKRWRIDRLIMLPSSYPDDALLRSYDVGNTKDMLAVVEDPATITLPYHQQVTNDFNQQNVIESSHLKPEIDNLELHEDLSGKNYENNEAISTDATQVAHFESNVAYSDENTLNYHKLLNNQDSSEMSTKDISYTVDPLNVIKSENDNYKYVNNEGDHTIRQYDQNYFYWNEIHETPANCFNIKPNYKHYLSDEGNRQYSIVQQQNIDDISKDSLQNKEEKIQLQHNGMGYNTNYISDTTSDSAKAEQKKPSIDYSSIDNLLQYSDNDSFDYIDLSIAKTADASKNQEEMQIVRHANFLETDEHSINLHEIQEAPARRSNIRPNYIQYSSAEGKKQYSIGQDQNIVDDISIGSLQSQEENIQLQLNDMGYNTNYISDTTSDSAKAEQQKPNIDYSSIDNLLQYSDKNSFDDIDLGIVKTADVSKNQETQIDRHENFLETDQHSINLHEIQEAPARCYNIRPNYIQNSSAERKRQYSIGQEQNIDDDTSKDSLQYQEENIQKPPNDLGYNSKYISDTTSDSTIDEQQKQNIDDTTRGSLQNQKEKIQLQLNGIGYNTNYISDITSNSAIAGEHKPIIDYSSVDNLLQYSDNNSFDDINLGIVKPADVSKNQETQIDWQENFLETDHEILEILAKASDIRPNYIQYSSSEGKLQYLIGQEQNINDDTSRDSPQNQEEKLQLQPDGMGYNTNYILDATSESAIAEQKPNIDDTSRESIQNQEENKQLQLNDMGYNSNYISDINSNSAIAEQQKPNIDYSSIDNLLQYSENYSFDDKDIAIVKTGDASKNQDEMHIGMHANFLETDQNSRNLGNVKLDMKDRLSTMLNQNQKEDYITRISLCYIPYTNVATYRPAISQYFLINQQQNEDKLYVNSKEDFKLSDTGVNTASIKPIIYDQQPRDLDYEKYMSNSNTDFKSDRNKYIWHHSAFPQLKEIQSNNVKVTNNRLDSGSNFIVSSLENQDNSFQNIPRNFIPYAEFAKTNSKDPSYNSNTESNYENMNAYFEPKIQCNLQLNKKQINEEIFVSHSQNEHFTTTYPVKVDIDHPSVNIESKTYVPNYVQYNMNYVINNFSKVKQKDSNDIHTYNLYQPNPRNSKSNVESIPVKTNNLEENTYDTNYKILSSIPPYTKYANSEILRDQMSLNIPKTYSESSWSYQNPSTNLPEKKDSVISTTELNNDNINYAHILNEASSVQPNRNIKANVQLDNALVNSQNIQYDKVQYSPYKRQNEQYLTTITIPSKRYWHLPIKSFTQNTIAPLNTKIYNKECQFYKPNTENDNALRSEEFYDKLNILKPFAQTDASKTTTELYNENGNQLVSLPNNKAFKTINYSNRFSNNQPINNNILTSYHIPHVAKFTQYENHLDTLNSRKNKSFSQNPFINHYNIIPYENAHHHVVDRFQVKISPTSVKNNIRETKEDLKQDKFQPYKTQNSFQKNYINAKHIDHQPSDQSFIFKKARATTENYHDINHILNPLTSGTVDPISSEVFNKKYEVIESLSEDDTLKLLPASSPDVSNDTYQKNKLLSQYSATPRLSTLSDENFYACKNNKPPITTKYENYEVSKPFSQDNGVPFIAEAYNESSEQLIQYTKEQDKNDRITEYLNEKIVVPQNNEFKNENVYASLNKNSPVEHNNEYYSVKEAVTPIKMNYFGGNNYYHTYLNFPSMSDTKLSIQNVPYSNFNPFNDPVPFKPPTTSLKEDLSHTFQSKQPLFSFPSSCYSPFLSSPNVFSYVWSNLKSKPSYFSPEVPQSKPISYQTINQIRSPIFDAQSLMTDEISNPDKTLDSLANSLKTTIYNWPKIGDLNGKLTIPIGKFGLAKLNQDNNYFILKTDDPNILIRGWKTNIKIIKAKLLLETQDLPVLNFLPEVVKGNYDPKLVQNIAKAVIQRQFGEPIVIKDKMTVYKPYILVSNSDMLKSGSCKLLWPTYNSQFNCWTS